MHYAYIEEEVDGKPWYYDIQLYVRNQQYPEHASENDKRILQRLATRFFLDGEICIRKKRSSVA